MFRTGSAEDIYNWIHKRFLELDPLNLFRTGSIHLEGLDLSLFGKFGPWSFFNVL